MVLVARGVILFSTGILILAVALKVFLLGSADLFDRLTALFAVLLFFGDQLTR